MSRPLLRLLSVVACLAAPFGARAQDAAYPTQNITLVVPYAAGGPPDVASRILAPAIGAALGRSVIIENRVGASTSIGSAAVARAAPDGHTILLIDSGVTVAPSIVANAGFDPKAFEPVAPLLRTFMTLVTHPSVPAKDVKELIALAKAKPGDLKYGSSGVGTPPHLGALAFIQATGVDMLHVPYRGVALALNDVVAGHLSLVFVSQSTAASQVAAGKAKVLAIFGEKRAASMPEVATFREQGVDAKIVDEGTFFGIAAPPGTPKPIVARLNKVINDALKDPDTLGRLQKADFHVTGGTPEELGKIIRENTDYWREAFSKAGVKPE
ncbi:MAG TPA: tripartite tricarboxylate transporter substrate binding protein [Beijerinckiaceae bacterium]|jgi:tripartite-type tricarboxylate transporter receptor subunit TctC